MDDETKLSLRLTIHRVIAGLPYKLLKGGESVKNRGAQYQRQDEVTALLIAALERFEIKAPPSDPFPGRGPGFAPAPKDDPEGA